ncbi:alpha/beta fold hydrolase [Lapillicoccus jejuensis]|uniref:Pimeloyl-ACP methyl ester carboxylesterase n=1 Tax=Lapillicoccus jejuensis TaxID=402171 RepID=A0A542DZJ6_9MICO|nr:alpha/beta hydrolase [Lapillicoccus jejuensis]TQJ08486.1 pimeloyl-ACP methyl ester carboxylesterase [Lapillicoccus jejuensis]
MESGDLTLADGRTLHWYDAGGDGAPVVWHHGTGNTGEPPQPLLAGAARRGLRFLGLDRPGYGGSTPLTGRDVAEAARLTQALADHRGLGRFAVLGHSGGGPHALACGALLGDRVTAAVSVAGPAPLGPVAAEGRDWYAGFAPYGAASLRAAEQGRAARMAYEESGADDDFGFLPSDEEALRGEWSWFLTVVRSGNANGPGPSVDDDLATVTAWGYDVEDVACPTLLVHGAEDRVVPAAHSRWLARHVPGAQLWEEPEVGHLGVLVRRGDDVLGWVQAQAPDSE